MALPLPNLFEANRVLSNNNFVGRGPRGFQQDPITSSQVTNTIVYPRLDVCGRPAYVQFRKSLTINGLIECQNLSHSYISIQGFVPVNADSNGNLPNEAAYRDYIQSSIDRLNLRFIGGTIANLVQTL